ncbi:two component transcriptional regulator, LuxR family [Rhizobiales bacterium GAS191]|nr:two component transcriptional regulator, LuxR family [Rhizobiales bacterium GAS113]SEE19852.1 two component transcriptional regulator, LuxR family [Rhizobiales bacterium GAS188]SEE36978.1 two component transcriptional regulator, LuxR family [Rhizobiales bacterium GAS191]
MVAGAEDQAERPDATGPDPIRILIAEDQSLLRNALAKRLSLEPDMVIVAQAADGDQAIREARSRRPDVILMDLQMPRVDGIAATRAILADNPRIRIIVLTTFETDELILGAIAAGAQCYLLKDASETLILEAIRGCMTGDVRMSPIVAQRILAELRRTHVAAAPAFGRSAKFQIALTEREQNVLSLIIEGLPNRDIAARLGLSEGRVRNLVSQLLEKHHARNRTELALTAARRPRGAKP